MTPSILLTQGIQISIVLAVVGLAFAILLIRKILAASPGNDKMALIGGAIQQGAKAYMSRQIRAVSIIAVIVFAIVWYVRGGAASAGFVIGAVCSMIAGYIGMMIAVRASGFMGWCCTAAADSVCASPRN